MRRVAFFFLTLVLLGANFVHWMLYLTLPLSMSEVTCGVISQTSPQGTFHTLTYLDITGPAACFQRHHTDDCAAYSNITAPCYIDTKGNYDPVPFLTRREAMCHYFGICQGLEILGDVLGVGCVLYLCLIVVMTAFYVRNWIRDKVGYDKVEQIADDML